MNNHGLDFQFDHAGITVYSLDEAVELYETDFGYEQVKTFEKPSLGIKGATLELKNSLFEILQPLSTKQDGDKAETLLLILQEPGTIHLAFNVDDINLAYNTFKKNNILVTKLFDSRFFFYQNLNENLIEIRQRK